MGSWLSVKLSFRRCSEWIIICWFSLFAFPHHICADEALRIGKQTSCFQSFHLKHFAASLINWVQSKQMHSVIGPSTMPLFLFSETTLCRYPTNINYHLFPHKYTISPERHNQRSLLKQVDAAQRWNQEEGEEGASLGGSRLYVFVCVCVWISVCVCVCVCV